MSGYHGTRLLSGFSAATFGPLFSPEWGAIRGLPDGWDQRTPEEVREAIEKIIGPSSIDKVETIVIELAERTNDLRTSLTHRLSDAAKTSRTDRIFPRLRNYLSVASRMATSRLRYLTVWQQGISRAALQGTCIPPHLYYEGVGVEAEAVSKGVVEFIKLLGRLIESVQETASETSNVSELPLWDITQRNLRQVQKLYRDGSYPEAVEKSFKS